MGDGRLDSRVERGEKRLRKRLTRELSSHHHLAEDHQQSQAYRQGLLEMVRESCRMAGLPSGRPVGEPI